MEAMQLPRRKFRNFRELTEHEDSNRVAEAFGIGQREQVLLVVHYIARTGFRRRETLIWTPRPCPKSHKIVVIVRGNVKHEFFAERGTAIRHSAVPPYHLVAEQDYTVASEV
jgi:hypothetical protein